MCVSTRRLLSAAGAQAAGAQPEDIACVVFSGQMMGCVAMDEQTRPLRNAIIWADQRAVEEARLLEEQVGLEETYRITGHRPSPSYSGEKLLWLRRCQPEVFARAYKFLHAKDFIVARLTGRFVTDYSDASGSNLYDLSRQDWSDDILLAVRLERRLLPELHASSDVVGEVTHRAAEETGLAVGTPVVIGGGGACAAVGAGVGRPGAAYNYIGSSSWIGIAAQQPIFDPALRTFTFAHLPAGLFTPTGTMQSAGGAYQWARETFAAPEKEAAAALGVSPYELMNLQVEKSPPGANGLLFLPYLMGERSPRWNPEARGAYISITVQHTRADLLRATLEGVAFNLRVILDAFQEQGAGGRGDARDRRRRAGGGLAADPGGYLRHPRSPPGAAGGGHFAGRSHRRRRGRGPFPRFQHRRKTYPPGGRGAAQSAHPAGVSASLRPVQPPV